MPLTVSSLLLRIQTTSSGTVSVARCRVPSSSSPPKIHFLLVQYRMRVNPRLLLNTCAFFTSTKASHSFLKPNQGPSLYFSLSSASAFSFSKHGYKTNSKDTSLNMSEKNVKARTGLDEIKEGSFQRKESVWRDQISSDEGAKFPPESDRYHLFVAYACPWAHRALMVRGLKGLEDAISVTVTHPIWKKTKPDDPNDAHSGWVFGDKDGEEFSNTLGEGGPFPSCFPGNEPEPFFKSSTIRELYEKANDTNGKYTVPILWDKKLNTIVNNESSEIIRMLNSEFNEFAKNPDLDLYSNEMKNAIDEVNDWVYPTINNGVYRCGFATTQKAYDIAIEELTNSFDRIESILQKQRYIAGSEFTEADVRLFVTLLRFDEVYVVYFKTNTRSVANSPAMLNYMREIYQMPGIAETCNMEQIKAHYFCSHAKLNPYSIVPRGSNFIDLLSQPHNRAD